MNRRWKMAGLAAIAVAFVLGMVFTAEQMATGPTFCAFRLLSGLDCPGCGMTRALAALLHGDVETAVVLHPMVVVVFPVLVALLLAGMLEFLWRRPVLDNIPEKVLNRFSLVLVFLFVAIWSVRTFHNLSDAGLSSMEQSIIYRLVHAMI